MDYQCIIVYTIITILPPPQTHHTVARAHVHASPQHGCLALVKRAIKRYAGYMSRKTRGYVTNHTLFVTFELNVEKRM